MRKSIVFMIVFAACSLIASKASAVPLSQDQVKTVCGKKLQEGSEGSGCSKSCGLHGEAECFFTCSKKTGKCDGTAVYRSQGSSGKNVRAVKQLVNRAGQ